MGRSSGGGGTQQVVRDIPEEAKPYLYGAGDKFIEDPETGEMIENPDYVQGVLPFAQELFTMTPEQRTEAGMDYQIAGFDPMQEQAFSLAQQGIGAYKPYLERGDKALGSGIRAVEGAIGETKRLAGQIPGEVRPGQEALRRAAQGVESAAQRGEAAGQRAAQETREATSMAMPFQQEGLAAIRRGQEFLGGAAGAYDPTSAQAYMDPYQQQVVDLTLEDIQRAGARQLEDIGKRTEQEALQQGAFSGRRRFLERERREEPVREEILRRQAATAAGLRSQGYQTAQQQAQQAFEQQQQRQMGVGQLFGQLGTQTGALGTSFGQLGLQGAGQAGQLGMQGAGMGMQGAQQAGQLGAQASQLGLQGITTGLGAQQQVAGMGQGLGSLGMQSAQMGGMAQQMGQADVNLLSQLGAQRQRQEQAQMDASRANAMAPYQQAGFMSDIIQGAPIGSAQTTFAPGPSPFQQATGAAIAYGGLNRAGVFS
jgi:hypothetical protein